LLGTGTAKADPTRSGPALGVVCGDRIYVVDFGPGVVRRASAACAAGESALDPARLEIAFLTQLHSDHPAGYPELMLTP
jgi:ribonuclease BN (tRNA processing enzyme)